MYHANLTQSITYRESHILQFCRRANEIVYARFEDFRTFLHVFMSSVEVFVRYELWVMHQSPSFFPTVDCSFQSLARFVNAVVQYVFSYLNN